MLHSIWMLLKRRLMYLYSEANICQVSSCRAYNSSRKLLENSSAVLHKHISEDEQGGVSEI